MPILNLQKRARELGRIRMGQKGDRGQPQKLDRFRMTATSKVLLEKVAELYGGEVREWTPAGGVQQWEVYTQADRLPILVPPQPVSQWYETWSAGGCTHRCDGETDYISGEPCDLEGDLHLASKPTTRLKVVLRDVEGVGVWRLESHGFNAAVELPEAAEFLAQANGYVDGFLAIEERVQKSIDPVKGPQTKKFKVPVIEIAVTPAQLLAGHGVIRPPSLQGGPVERAALPAGQSGEQPAGAAEQPPPMPGLDDIAAAMDPEVVRNIWRFLNHHGALTEELSTACAQRIAALTPEQPAPGPDADGAYEAEVVHDPAAEDDVAASVWQRVIAEAGKQGLTLPATQSAYEEFSGGTSAAIASAEELEAFLTYLQGGGAGA